MSSYNDLRNKIKSLNRLDVDKADYNYIKKIISEMHDGLRTLVVNSDINNSFFRVRINPKKKPMDINELKSPPSSLITGFQRCNQPNNPKFYASSKRITALIECNAKQGDTVFICQWRVKKRFALNYVLLNDPKPESGIKFYPTPAESTFLTYIDTVFTKPIHKTFSNQYKITAAITEQLTKGYKREENDNIHIHPEGYIGLYYPSVMDIERGYNISIYPEIVDSCLELAHVMEAKITDKHDERIEIEVIDNSNDINDNIIKWLGDSKKIPLGKINKDQTMYSIINGKWSLVVRASNSSPDELQRLLEE